MKTLVDDLLRTGLVQFGRFNGGAPVQLNFDLLPAYPDVLRRLALASLPKMSAVRCDRLLGAADAMPLGIALSLEAGIPLVYSRGNGAAPAQNLAGAYDVGHPALLVVNTWQADEHAALIEQAREVGLEVTGVLTILERDRRETVALPLPVISLLDVDGVLTHLASENRVPAGQIEAIREWFAAD
jgi:orotate phosphoribosyltransferase